MSLDIVDRNSDIVDHDPAAVIADGPSLGADDATAVDGTFVEDEFLVEEISIDGMCGVY
ncbi:MAG: mycofactocin precursor MftA [Microthrixaceae bacterium]